RQVDFEEHVISCGEALDDGAAGRAVAVVRVGGVFEQVAVEGQLLERRWVDEEVVDPVRLPGARGSGGDGNGIPDVRQGGAQPGQDGRFADSGGARDHIQTPAAVTTAGLRLRHRRPLWAPAADQ